MRSSRRPCSARASRPSTLCATPAPAPAISSPFTALAASGISESSSRRQGFRTVAVNRGRDKEELARKLGASDYIDSAAEDPAKALTAMGGAKAILATVTDGQAMQAIAGGLGPSGVMMVIGAVGPLTIDSFDLLQKCAAIKGWYSGIARDSEDTLRFSLLNKVASMNEVYPLEKAQEAYQRMMSGKARFRVVLKMDA